MKKVDESNMFYCTELGVDVKSCPNNKCYHHTCSYNTFYNTSVEIDKTRERQDKDVKPRFKLF